MRQNKKNKGFTLVELLIVVAIIGILAAVLTPQFLNARKVAVDTAAKAYAHNLYTAVQAHNATETTPIPATGTTPIDCKAGFPDGSLITQSQYRVAAVDSVDFTGTDSLCTIAVKNDGAIAIELKYTNGAVGTVSLPQSVTP